MTSALLMFLLSVIKVQSVSSLPSCPASCVVCSKEAVICQRLAHIIDAPQTTQALLLTEGSIAAVQPGALSDLSNATVISLSHNRISALDEQSFRNMPSLQTLLLDHNLLTSQALQRGALTNLTQLEVLALGNNRISMIQSELLKGTKALRILKLEGNLITRLDSGSFPLYDLQSLESLDLSDNFIDYLDKSSFRGLISLKTLDLSRNRLQTAPSEAFSYLSWLTNLNLDLNSWNCSCQLLELAAFLSTFIQEPDKTLYNGRRMVCVSADNPAVTTVLELTEANCVPSNQNITVRIDTRGSITPQLYVRDMAITGVVCFTGGVALTLLIVLIYYKVFLKKKLREWRSQEEVKEEGSSTMSSHNRNHNETVERREDFMNGNGTMHSHLGPRTVENGSHFRCPECREEEPLPNPMRWERMNGRIETLEDREKQRMRIEEDRRRNGLQHRNMARDSLNKQLVGNNIDMEGKSRQELLHCGSCHRTYRPNHTEQNTRHGRVPPNPRDSFVFPQQRPNDWGRNHSYSEFDIKSLGLKKETRNVTFDLASPGRALGTDTENEEATTPRSKERRQEKKNKAQSSRSLKVKLNLNPLRKSKVHPKNKSEGSPRKSRDKRKDGKDRRDKEGKGKKTKDGKGKTKKSKRSTEDGEEVDDGGKNKTSTKQKKSKSEQESAGPNVDGKETVAHVAPPAAMGQMHGLLGAQFKGGGLLLGNTQLPFSLADRNRTTNLLGSPGSSQLPGSSLPFQGGNFLLNSVGPGNAMFPPGPANTMAPNVNLSAANMAPGGAPDNLMRQTLVGLTASSNTGQGKQTNHNPVPLPATATALQANTTVLQASPTTLPANASSQNLQALAANLAANPSLTPSVVQPDSKSQLPPESSPSAARVKSNPVQEPLQTTPTFSSETLTSPRKESQTPLVSDISPVVGAQTPITATVVENVSNSNSVTESVSAHGEGRVVTFTEGPTAATTVGGTQAADVSVSGVSAPAGSTDNAASTALIQQEYVSDDGSSSPRRKLRLVIPEKTSSRPPTALERKIR